MISALLADLLLILHGLFVLFVVLGAWLCLRWPRVAWVHVPSAAWGAWIEFSGRICPLTPLENHFRHRAGQAGYEGGFIEHYLHPLLYPAGLTGETQFVLGLLVLAANAFAYGWVIRRYRSGRPAS